MVRPAAPPVSAGVGDLSNGARLSQPGAVFVCALSSNGGVRRIRDFRTARTPPIPAHSLSLSGYDVAQVSSAAFGGEPIHGERG